MILIDFGVTVH